MKQPIILHFMTNAIDFQEICQTDLRFKTLKIRLTLSRRRPLSYGNQSIDLQSKSIDWFLYDNGICHKELSKYLRIALFLLTRNRTLFSGLVV